VSEDQSSLELADQNNIEDVENYKFQPIKGYPMLNWRGKRPFNSTQFYPAQLKETYGGEVDGWRNKIFWGDNLQVMSHLLKEFRGKVNLIYIDPPFDSKADYKKRIKVKSKSVENDQTSFEEKQYADIWSNDDYLQFMYERLVLCRELLSDQGTFFLHCDWNQGHYLKILADEIFGAANFKNHIVWKRSTPRGNASSKFPEINDFVLFYTKTQNYKWTAQYTEYSQEYVDKYYNQVDAKTGRYFQPTSLLGHDGINPVREWKGFSKPWRYPLHRLDELDQTGQIYWPRKGGIPRFKRFLDEQKGIPVQSLWDDIPPVNSQALDDTGYPTQKPEKLIERIISSSTEEGDIVFDCFMGSGTTQSVSMKLGRKFIGADINVGSIQTSTKRLIKVSTENRQNDIEDDTLRYTGFEVYSVNNYEIFRNPAQAKELLLDALEIQKLETNSIYDGEKDGHMVKIMPVNRIATKADLEDIAKGFDLRAFEKRQNDNPTKPVEKIQLVCMGHENDLGAQLEMMAKPFKIEVEVVDILRDKSQLEFKRDSKAKLIIKGGYLEIDQFYPMNLLQKLSLQQEQITDWKELVESVMVDWNYDGAVRQPIVLDVPDKNELVKGKYKIPEDAGTIRVKITDLLSESWEGNIDA